MHLAEKRKEIGINKTEGRWVTIRSQTKHLLEFVGGKTKITDISNTKWDGYFLFRREKHPNVVNSTLSNEKNTIRSVFRYAIRRNYIPHTRLPEFPHLDASSRRREAFDRSEWKKIYNFLKSNKWLKGGSEKVTEQRWFIRYFILILANTGLRFGEARSLQWKNVKIATQKNEKGREFVIAKISLSKEQTKNRKARLVIGRRGDVFEKIREISEHTKPNDYVFVDNETGNPIVRDTYYKHWNYMVNETGIGVCQQRCPVFF